MSSARVLVDPQRSAFLRLQGGTSCCEFVPKLGSRVVGDSKILLCEVTVLKSVLIKGSEFEVFERDDCGVTHEWLPWKEDDDVLTMEP